MAYVVDTKLNVYNGDTRANRLPGTLVRIMVTGSFDYTGFTTNIDGDLHVKKTVTTLQPPRALSAFILSKKGFAKFKVEGSCHWILQPHPEDSVGKLEPRHFHMYDNTDV